MIVTFSALTSIIAIYGETTFLIRLNVYVLPFFLVLFLYILFLLIRFYLNARKYPLFPERNHLIKMKFWHYPDIKDKRRLSLKTTGILIFLVLLIYVAVTAIFEVEEMRYALIILYSIVLSFSLYLTYVLLFITSFISARGSMQIFNAKYSDKVQQKGYWFFIFLPVPWIVFITVWYFAGEILTAYSIFGGFLNLWFLVTEFLYGFLCLTGILTILKKNWRPGYTTSQISASLTFLTVIVIPGIIDIVKDQLGSIISLIGFVQLETSGGSSSPFLGPILSLIALGFFYIKGALDGWGDKLREYYAAWDNKLIKFNIKSEEDIKNQTYDKAFDKTPLNTDVPNAYPNSIFGLIILLLTFSGIIFGTGVMFSVLGTSIGVEHIEGFLFLNAFFTFWGIILGLFIYTIIILFRKQPQ